VAVGVAEGVGVTVKVGVKVGGRGVAVNWEIRVSSAITVLTAYCVPWAATVAATDVSTAPWSITGSVVGRMPQLLKMIIITVRTAGRIYLVFIEHTSFTGTLTLWKKFPVNSLYRLSTRFQETADPAGGGSDIIVNNPIWRSRMEYAGVYARYHTWMDIPEHTLPVTLLEGNTPLIPMPKLAESLGGGFSLWVKFEGMNPTGSFKDRGMTIAIGEAAGRGAKVVICASTGNTAASAAAYAARAGMRCVVLIPKGKVAAGKLAGAVAHGADVIQIEGSFDDALSVVVEISNRHPIALVNSLNPYRLEGQKTAAFEICEILGSAPDWLCLPVGNAGNITSYWMGFRQYHATHSSGLPHILGVQAQGSAPLVLGHPVEQPETVATAIRIGKPARGEEALSAASESGGQIMAASDDEILAMQCLLAASGVWVEPASAAGLAGLKKQLDQGRMDVRGQRVVAVCTGHGMKDPDIIAKSMQPPALLPLDYKAIETTILEGLQ